MHASCMIISARLFKSAVSSVEGSKFGRNSKKIYVASYGPFANFLFRQTPDFTRTIIVLIVHVFGWFSTVCTLKTKIDKIESREMRRLFRFYSIFFCSSRHYLGSFTPRINNAISKKHIECK